MPILDLRIDELMLHGFNSADRYAIANAIGRELTRLFNTGMVPPAFLEHARGSDDLHLKRLDAGTFDIPHDASPATVGVQVARAIHKGLGGTTASAQPQDRSIGTTPGVGRADR